MFAVGILPALVTFFFRRELPDTAPLQQQYTRPFRTLFSPEFRRTTVLASLLATFVLFAYWGLFTWLPGFLAAPKSAGGAGLSIVRTSGWISLSKILSRTPVTLGKCYSSSNY